MPLQIVSHSDILHGRDWTVIDAPRPPSSPRHTTSAPPLFEWIGMRIEPRIVRIHPPVCKPPGPTHDPSKSGRQSSVSTKNHPELSEKSKRRMRAWDGLT
ncbi:hypothetical protein NUW54_g3196 [Trametes sanguinea]|uniref:Uncharacterized protein n=1 Tax=Trametes sanguinea TaxID=158606 RepID=A0ACC1Q419_9APHY|nr:hypothetical protein NUW54_g3196 [Trametes sanguinea]